MREILFRAKRKDNDEWVEGYVVNAKWYLDEKEMYVIIPTDVCFFPHCEISEWYEVDENTLCQYTGIKDRNGNKIFEGDIVKDIYTNKGYVMQVEWNDYYCGFKPFCLCDNYGEKLYLERNEDCIIVGNVFDNQKN